MFIRSVLVRHGGKILGLASVVWILSCLAVAFFWAYGDGRLTILLVVFTPRFWIYSAPWMIVPGILLIHAFRALILKRRLSGLRWIAVGALGVSIVWPGNFIGERLRFYTTKSAYDDVIANVEAGACSTRNSPALVEFLECEKPILVTFEWGGLGSSWFGIVYDAADEIAKPVELRSASWKARDTGKMLSCSSIGVWLGGHYYVAGGSLGDDCG